MTTLFFDIETIPTDLPWVIEDLRANIRPPSNYSKPETIEKWMAENAESAFEGKLHATGLDGSYGRICCIGYAFDDEPVQTIGTHLQLTERTILADFASELSGKRITKIVGHNVAEFDLQFLKKRAIINCAKIDLPFDAKPWDEKIYDTMLKWDAKKSIGLDKLARVLGIEGKQGMDGSMVWDYYKAGRHAEIAEYCADDVRITRELYKRMSALQTL